MHNKAQITAFIVIGLFLILIFLILLNLVLQQRTEFVSTSELFEAYKGSITQCLEQQAVLSLFIVFEKFSDYKDLPDKNILVDMLETQLGDNAELCVPSDVPGLSLGNYSIDIDIEEESVVFDINFPIEYKAEDQIYYEDDFATVIPVGLSELYDRVKSIVEHNKSLDLSFLLSQRLNIEIVGCEGDRINYVVNDKSYRVEDATLQFFFATGLENLVELFSFDRDLKFLVPTIGGKHVLRQAGNEKRLLFDADNEGIVNGCFKKFVGEEYFSFGLVENNVIPAMITTIEPKRVDIRKTFIEDNDLFLPYSGFEFSSEFEVTPIRLVMLGKDNLYYDQGSWVEVNASLSNGYLISDIAKLGKYATGTPICYSSGIGLELNFIPSDYLDIQEFRTHVGNYSSALLRVGLDINTKAYLKKTDIDCSAWGSVKCKPSFVESSISCESGGLKVVLIDNPRFGFDHRLENDTIYLGSYLADNSSFCAECYLLYELGNYYGLNVSGFNLTPSEMSISVFGDLISELKVVGSQR